ncbi:ABC transporter substrate-binding protein [Rhodovibrio salinarum]|uniref:ABC transporter substrate-binding protein n=1 Tax=Rhodovibrio salinarum TaxID=1087 RepID=A0A934QM04_9PROT|nr:ABC transporter substrate-binding protein [Rhodovibrio salinarum]MBK1699122.1 ABC transporter substrate-binding protein [Rhodovibrio salinarum]
MNLKTIVPVVAVGLVTLAGPASAEDLQDTSDMRIALSNNYAGNSWRQAMLKSWEENADEAVSAGVVQEAPSFTTAENQATEQAQQLQNLILQGYDAIVIDAASPTALNGTVRQACEQGIVVVSFDAVVTEPCAYRIEVDFKGMGERQVEYLADRLEGSANLLEIRGLSGTSVDENIHAGIAAGVEAVPRFEIVGSVHGDWTQSVAQKEVAGILPTLPEVDAVVTQGGDGYGAAQAFKSAGRDLPIIIMGNRHDELTWWKQQKDANQYETMSVSISPGSSTFAFWVAQQILAGREVPKQMTLPMLTVNQDNLEKRLEQTQEGSVTNKTYSKQEVIDFIQQAKSN